MRCSGAGGGHPTRTHLWFWLPLRKNVPEVRRSKRSADTRPALAPRFGIQGANETNSDDISLLLRAITATTSFLNMSSSSHEDSDESPEHQQQPLGAEIPDAGDDDSDESYFPPFKSRRSHEGSTGSAILEALPLLRRPSIYLDRTKSNVSLGTGRGPTYGSDDGQSINEDGGPLVRVQSGVKKVEAITLLWTRKSLIVAYVRYPRDKQLLDLLAASF